MDKFIYFIFNFNTKNFEILELSEFELKKTFYYFNSFFGCAYEKNNNLYILNSSQLDTALFYKDKKYLKNFIRADFNNLYNYINCFDWIQENKNIVRRLLK